jgi:ABC-2 type transport system permease protein
MKQNKLLSVIRHEYLTIVKQPTFWLIMLAIPVLIAAVISITYFTEKATEDRISEAVKKVDNVAIIDKSGLVRPEILKVANLSLIPAAQEESVIKDVREGRLDGAVVYPENLVETRKFAVYSNTNDYTQSTAFSEFGSNILKSSLYAPLGAPGIIQLAQEGASSDVTSFENGRQTAGIAEYIVPGMILVLFYLILVFSVNYMLVSVVEEKENRSMEMVLTYVKPRTLILGKLLGISLVTLTQLLFLLTIALSTYFIIKQLPGFITLPFDIDLSTLVFDPSAILFGLGYLVFGFLMFAALMAGVGSMVPSAKDAGGLSFVFIIGAILPFYTVSILATDPQNPVTQFMTYFPTTAPTTLLIRNTVGNLSSFESIVGLLCLMIWSVLAVMLAGKLFRLGALEYSNRLSLKSILRR